MTSDSNLEFVSDVVEYRASIEGDKTYIHFEEDRISFSQFFRASCSLANGLAEYGARPGDGVAIVMQNCPEYLLAFNGMQHGGFYTVPVNTALKGEGLRYILTNSDVKYVFVDDFLYPKLAELGRPLGAIEKVFVRRAGAEALPPHTIDFACLLEASPERPAHKIRDGDIIYLMYTSGTTGLPKGVVNRQVLGVAKGMLRMLEKSTPKHAVNYTCLPLFHANALVVTAGFSMSAGISFGLDRKFSASGFWDRIRHYEATTFNTIGAMIPILMKQPERPDDADNPVRIVHSAACPAALWTKFEKRFDVRIHEGYGAVDGGGVVINNRGDGPIGSVGRPSRNMVWKLVGEDGKEVCQGEIGELITKVQDRGTSVEYYNNPEASAEKIRGGWVHSGDLFYADKDGYLYFVDRKTDSIRRRGENISSFEVENVVEKHGDVARCAAFGVPSELGEDEVMIWVQPKEGTALDLRDLIAFCADSMAGFMVPRYINVVDDIPQTGTLRVIKSEMKRQGVTEGTWDREKEMSDLKLKKT